MLKLVGGIDPKQADGETGADCRVFPFPVGLSAERGKREDELPLDEPALDAAWAVERAMLDVELNFMKLKRQFEQGDDRPRAA